MSVLQRKAQAGKQEHQARAMTVPKALRVSIAKIADKVFDMALAVIGNAQERCEGDTIAETLDDNALLILLDGPGRSPGGVMIGPELVAAMIQQQTTGKVSTTAPAPRPLTSTDAALCAPLIDQLFQRAHGLLENDADRDVLALYKFGARVENARLFGLALDATEYNVIKLTIDIAGGAFQSGLTLLLPVVDKRVEPVSSEHADPDEAAAPLTLEKTMSGIKADLTAILGRVRLPLSRLEKLSVGDEFPLRPDAFEAVEIMTLDGRVISRGAMGQVDGQRAVQLENPAATPGSPKRRAADRDDLNLPQVEMADLGSEGGTPGRLPAPGDAGGFAPAVDMPDLPDLSVSDGEEPLPDLPALESTSELPDLPDLTDLPDLPELPDLPDLDTPGELPQIDGLTDLKTA